MRDWRWVEVCLGSRRRRRSLEGASAGYGEGRRELTERYQIGLLRPW